MGNRLPQEVWTSTWLGRLATSGLLKQSNYCVLMHDIETYFNICCSCFEASIECKNLFELYVTVDILVKAFFY